MTESELQGAVIDLAQTFKWRTYHTHDSRRSAAGFPDLVMVRAERLIFAELKSEKGRVSIDQIHWLNALADSGCAEVAVWRPADWTSGEIERVLRAR